MIVLIIALLVVISLLAIDDVRMRMEPSQDDQDRLNLTNERQNDGHQELSVDGDTVYPQPLPDSLIEQGTDWTSDNVDTPTDAS